MMISISMPVGKPMEMLLLANGATCSPAFEEPLQIKESRNLSSLNISE
jgi:hypothetical protein